MLNYDIFASMLNLTMTVSSLCLIQVNHVSFSSMPNYDIFSIMLNSTVKISPVCFIQLWQFLQLS